MADTTYVAEYAYSSNNSTSGTVSVDDTGMSSLGAHPPGPDVTRNRRSSDNKIERAVYAHIRAVRTLGRTHINTSEIADALSLKVSEVNRAIEKLRDKGVRGF
jgi:hypothetical protein